jgi:tRNA(adenine34) deaminase
VIVNRSHPEHDGADIHDKEFMRQALQLAEIALGRGNPPVGTVVIYEGRTIGEGIEGVQSEKDLTAHSEIRAIREGCRALGRLDLAGCTLYTTVEPCFMCSFVIRKAGVSRVVSGKEGTRMGGISSNHPILIDPAIPGWPPPPEVVTGVLEKECAALFAHRALNDIAAEKITSSNKDGTENGGGNDGVR